MSVWENDTRVVPTTSRSGSQRFETTGRRTEVGMVKLNQAGESEKE